MVHRKSSSDDAEVKVRDSAGSAEVARLRARVIELEGLLARLRAESGEKQVRLRLAMAELQAQLADRDRQLAAIVNSKAWLFMRCVWWIRPKVAPDGSWRQRVLYKFWRLTWALGTRGVRGLRGVRQRLASWKSGLYDLGRRLLPFSLRRWLKWAVLRRSPFPKPMPYVRTEKAFRRLTFECPPELRPVPRGKYDLIVFSIIDWDFRFQRPQQIAAQFGRHGHRVFYLSTTSFLRSTDKRPAELIPKAPNVFETRLRSPRHLDIYGGKLSPQETLILADAVEELAEATCIGDAVLAVQIPFWAPVAQELRRRRGWRIFYDCMDEWTHFPGIGKSVLALEEELVASADLTVVSGEILAAKFQGRARRLLIAKNGVDNEHYRQFYRDNSLLADLPHPIIGYFGALASWVDVPLLEKIADEFSKATLVLAGGEFDVDLRRLRRRPNVRLLGQRPYEEMPQLLWHFDVCIIPFQINDITHATNPVKLYEYFYSGKPVVAPDLRELRPFAEVCYLSGDHESFLANLRIALEEPEDDPRRELRRQIAAANDWSTRYQLIDASLRESYPLVSVVVVTCDGWEHTRRCLESLLESETWPRLEVIVVDNASRDETPARLRELAASDQRLRVIFNTENRGFAAAINQGLSVSRGDIVVFLNNDTVVPPGLLGRLVYYLEADPTIGLLCPTTNFCGNEALVEPWYKTLKELPAYAAWRARAYRGKTFDLSVAAMYCVAARREVLERVGPLDEAYGLGMFEDDDYSLRVREAGFRVVCAEDAYVHHVGQASFSKLSPEEYHRIWKRNQEYFERKWGRPWSPHKPRAGVRPVTPKVR